MKNATTSQSSTFERKKTKKKNYYLIAHIKKDKQSEETQEESIIQQGIHLQVRETKKASSRILEQTRTESTKKTCRGILTVHKQVRKLTN